MVAIKNEHLFSEKIFCLNLLRFVSKSQVIVLLKFLYGKYQNHVYDTLETHTACLHLMVYFFVTFMTTKTFILIMKQTLLHVVCEQYIRKQKGNIQTFFEM